MCTNDLCLFDDYLFSSCICLYEIYLYKILLYEFWIIANNHVADSYWLGNLQTAE